MSSPGSFEEYLAGLTEAQRDVIQSMRQTIKAAVPEAVETIAYQMPAFRSHGGQFLVSYAAYKNHYSLFPASDDVIKAVGQELTPFVVGQGTIRFPAGKPISADLVTRIVKARFAEVAARGRG
jgi:uncharacterized protein YdhG (YjbR/CyaY superfamily)